MLINRKLQTKPAELRAPLGKRVSAPPKGESQKPLESFAGTALQVVALTRPSFESPRTEALPFLEPDATSQDLSNFMDGLSQGSTVQVSSGMVSTAAEIGADKSVKVASLVGGPLGATPAEVKAFEAAQSVENGASEVHLTMNLGAFNDGDFDVVSQEIHKVQEAVSDVPLRMVVPETLEPEQLAQAQKLAESAGAEVLVADLSPKRKGLHGMSSAPNNPSVPKGLSNDKATQDVLAWLSANPTTIGDILSIDDHTKLSAGATREEIATLNQQAKDNRTASACVNPYRVAETAEQLAGSGTKVCTVVGFPWGTNTSEVKAFETKTALAKGADEIDMVLNVGHMKAGETDKVLKDIRAVVEAAGETPVKVILETAYLNDAQIRAASELSMEAGAEFVKTSTGFAPRGARAHHLSIMRDVVGPKKGVKSSGDVRTLWDALVVMSSGASRIGASSMLKNFVKADFDPNLVVTPTNLPLLLSMHPKGSVAGY